MITRDRTRLIANSIESYIQVINSRDTLRMFCTSVDPSDSDFALGLIIGHVILAETGFKHLPSLDVLASLGVVCCICDCVFLSAWRLFSAEPNDQITCGDSRQFETTHRPILTRRHACTFSPPELLLHGIFVIRENVPQRKNDFCAVN